MGVGGTGFVNAPLTSSEVRNFKKEIKGILEDPIGTAEQLDQFLGPNIYTWEEMQSIMKIIFSQEERQLIRAARIKVGEKENPQGPPGEDKMPTVPPEWGQNNEEGRKHMNEYRNLIIKGIKEVAPRGQNAKKAFEAQQEKEESPAEWLDRLRKNMKQYSGLDPETDVGKALLRINFVTNAWPDIRKKLEKIEDWHNNSLDYLLKEAQKVYVRRDEEKAKLKAKLMAVTMRENNFQKIQKHTGTTSRDKINRDRGKEKIESQYKPSLISIPGMSAFTVGVRDIIGEIVLSRIQIIQYVDNLPLSGEDEVEVREATIKLLHFLGEKGLRVSKGKLQFVEPEVKYLGHLISKGSRRLSPERIAGILSLPPPSSKREIRKLLGLLGYCRLWIEGYTQAVKFLYEKLTEGDNKKWTKEDDDKLEKLKLKLASIPALSLPSLEKPFHLYVNVEKGVAHGVLVQEWGGVKRPVAYLSKMLDPVSHGWPVCIQAIAATAILVEESRKLTFGGQLIVCTPHAVRNVLNQKAEKWLTDSRMLKYEAILIDSDDLTLELITCVVQGMQLVDIDQKLPTITTPQRITLQSSEIDL
ncbi:hypothetical protein DUI87_34823 [Hirundo rustica rustica]|uniref:Reverse transcriptase/retrotransposon-derived protein RNase H-like domain-containing protein n=1 Tax=Hirundo rustica rustica TaxID=333673 RepID=A0A3M0IJ82_HIRRU|nr:hypothetical protein DUI87_34823 [Hirundo rustica rustica]